MLLVLDNSFPLCLKNHVTFSSLFIASRARYISSNVLKQLFVSWQTRHIFPQLSNICDASE